MIDEAPVAQADGAVDEQTLAIGAAVHHDVAHRSDSGREDRPSVEVEPSADTAHC